MRRNAEKPLSSTGAQRLGDWLRRQHALAPPVWQQPDIGTLVRYCAGLLTSTEAEAVERALSEDAGSRVRWLQVHEVLEALSQKPLAEIQNTGAGDDLQAQVTRLWREIVGVQAQEIVHAPRWRKTLEGALAEGSAVAGGVASLLKSLWYRWSAVLRVPEVAVARAGDSARVLVAENLPREPHVVVDRFEVGSDGYLHLRVVIQWADSSPRQEAVAVPISVALDLGGEIVPLAHGQVSGGAWEAAIPAPALLSPGRLPLGQIVVALGDVSVPATAQRVRIPVEIGDGMAMWAEVDGLLECVKGEIRLRLYLPEEVRDNYPDYTLALDICISPQVWQRAGEWSLRSWGRGYQLLTAPAPGIAEGVFASTALMRLQLIKH